VNKRKSTSLVAGVCTVCIATATGAAQPPVAPDHHESTVRVVSQEVALTASTGNRFVNIAALPLQNYFTIASTLGQLAAFVPPVNAPTGAFLQSNVATGNPWVDVAQLPFQNYFTIASTLGQLAAFVPPVNAATGAFFQGNFAPIPGLLTKAFNDELTAINNVLQLPGKIISYDLDVISRALGTVHTPFNANMSGIEREALSATLASFADKNVESKKSDVIDGNVVSVHTTIGDPADVDAATTVTSGADKKDADKKDADKKDAEVTGKKFSDVIGTKNTETNKKDANETGKKDAATTVKKNTDIAGAIRHAISNATGKKKADKDSAADSAAK
jgi:hypothetical protein